MKESDWAARTNGRASAWATGRHSDWSDSMSEVEVRVQELEAENAKLRAIVADADLLLGAGWQEAVMAVHGQPHDAAHHQVAKLAGDIAILQEENTRLKDELQKSVDRLANSELQIDDLCDALEPLAKANCWQLKVNWRNSDVWEVEADDVERARALLEELKKE